MFRMFDLQVILFELLVSPSLADIPLWYASSFSHPQLLFEQLSSFLPPEKWPPKSNSHFLSNHLQFFLTWRNLFWFVALQEAWNHATFTLFLVIWQFTILLLNMLNIIGAQDQGSYFWLLGEIPLAHFSHSALATAAVVAVCNILSVFAQLNVVLSGVICH